MANKVKKKNKVSDDNNDQVDESTLDEEDEEVVELEEELDEDIVAALKINQEKKAKAKVVTEIDYIPELENPARDDYADFDIDDSDDY